MSPCSAETTSSPWDVGAQGREGPRGASKGADRDRYRGRPPSLTVCLWPQTQENRYFYCLGVDQISEQPVSLSSGAWHLL